MGGRKTRRKRESQNDTHIHHRLLILKKNWIEAAASTKLADHPCCLLNDHIIMPKFGNPRQTDFRDPIESIMIIQRRTLMMRSYLGKTTMNKRRYITLDITPTTDVEG